MSLLASFNFAQWVVALGIIGVCGLLILVILVQQASGGGLVGAFGGGGGGGAFGAKTGDLFTVITVALAAIYLLLAVIGNYVFQPLDLSAPVAVVAPTSPSPELPVPVSDVVPDAAKSSPAGKTGAADAADGNAGTNTGTAGSATKDSGASSGGTSAADTAPDTPPGSP